MGKRGFMYRAGVFISTAIVFFIVAPLHANTIVTVEPGDSFINIANFNFKVLLPDAASSSNFSPSLPADWAYLPSGDIVSAFSSGSDLPSGSIGEFDQDVTLGEWVFGNQSSVTYKENVDYFVIPQGTNYLISGTPIPIPSTILLLGGGFVALVGLRRRKNS